MISDRFVNLIEKQANRLERRWADLIRSHPATPAYHSLDDEELRENIRKVYRHLGEYLSDSHDAEVLGTFLMDIGEQRRKQGIPLQELVFAIILARRNIWDFIMEEGVITTALEWHQVSDFWSSVMSFFDKNVYFVVAGYERETHGDRSRKDLVSKLLHSFSLGIFPEVDEERLSSS